MALLRRCLQQARKHSGHLDGCAELARSAGHLDEYLMDEKPPNPGYPMLQTIFRDPRNKRALGHERNS
jgi:hypothetical protein